jgi:hypothetical protein
MRAWFIKYKLKSSLFHYNMPPFFWLYASKRAILSFFGGVKTPDSNNSHTQYETKK